MTRENPTVQEKENARTEVHTRTHWERGGGTGERGEGGKILRWTLHIHSDKYCACHAYLKIGAKKADMRRRFTARGTGSYDIGAQNPYLDKNGGKAGKRTPRYVAFDPPTRTAIKEGGA